MQSPGNVVYYIANYFYLEITMDQKHIPCPNFRKCGGCQLQNMEYARQLSYKQGQVQKLLGGFGRAPSSFCTSSAVLSLCSASLGMLKT